MTNYVTKRSCEIYGQLQSHLVDGVASSFHKDPNQPYPISFDHGDGANLYDVDGNAYIDYVGGMGPMILGYASQSVNEAVIRQLEKGTQYAAPFEDLLHLTEKLAEVIPCAEEIAYQNTGTEANMLAFRLARAYTGKWKIIKFEGQYHGWSDEERVSTDARTAAELGSRLNPSPLLEVKGQLPTAADQIITLPWNDSELLADVLSAHEGEIAAVITEPLMCDSGPIMPQEGFLLRLRQLTSQHHVLLIFDEVITGFRLALGGAEAYYQVTPDLAVFAKAVANGFPLALVAGKKEIMSCGVHPTGTFNGNPVSVAAALATISELEKENVYSHLDALGRQLAEGLTALGTSYQIPLHASHAGAIVMLHFGRLTVPIDFRDALMTVDQQRYDQVVCAALARGVRLTPKRGRLYLSTAHSGDDIRRTLAIIDDVFQEIVSHAE